MMADGSTPKKDNSLVVKVVTYNDCKLWLYKSNRIDE